MKKGVAKKLKTGVLGATGIVGQRLICMLENHPWFEVTELAASEKSAGRSYADAARWALDVPLSSGLRNKKVKACRPPLDCDFVFSALPSDTAYAIENQFAEAGYPVVSNSGAHRNEPDVPLIVPEINSEHLKLIEIQKKNRNLGKGFIVTNPNCCVIIAALALAPLHRNFKLQQVFMATLQAISGAGYPGESAYDLADNVIPYIRNEEHKLEIEPVKILGQFRTEGVLPACLQISAHCHRVPVSEGHMISISASMEKRVEPEEAMAVLREFRGPENIAKLPSAPERPIHITDDPFRPQHRKDRNSDDGMSIVVGRIRRCPLFALRFTVLGHNTIRGAAGAALLNAEILMAQGYFS